MHDVKKTVVAVAIAGALLALAAFTRPAPITDARFSDQGELFFPAFTDPLAARSLEVIAFDAETASFRPFKVEMKDGKWVIPSHYDYPADAQENMAKAASAFIGLVKAQVVSDAAKDHEALGVLAPDDAAAPLSGRGTRVTFRGEHGAELASLIIGREAPDPAGEMSGSSKRRYVRAPDRARVYAVEFPATFSTKFADWVETDLLKLEGKRIDTLFVDRYEVDEQSATRRTVERLTLSRVLPEPIGTDEARWTLDAQPGGPLAANERLIQFEIEDTLRAFSNLRIVGVRPKPAGLAAALAGESSSIGQIDMLDLQARGFFLTRDGRFVANEGEVTITAEDGVVYNIAFGEIVAEQDETAEQTSPLGEEEGSEAEKRTPAGESRYALVRVSLDTSVYPEPPAPPEAPEPTAEGETGEGEEAAKASEPDDAAKQEYERKKAEREAKIAAAKARADALTRRFANWYYVIDASAFGDLRPRRAELVEVVPEAEAGAEVEPPAPDAAE